MDFQEGRVENKTRLTVDGDTLTCTQQRKARGVAVTSAATVKFIRAE